MNSNQIISLLSSNSGLWVLAGISLVGTVFNVLKKRIGFGIWIFTNAGWVLVNLHKDIPSQAALFAVYMAVSVWGFVSWGQKQSG